MAGLTDGIKAKAELSPIEDILLYVLRPALVGVSVQSLIEDAQTFPLVVARVAPDMGEWGGDPRFTDQAHVVVHTFCEDPDGDEDAAILAEVVRTILRDSRNVVVPGRGHITSCVMTSRPRRVTDWATATGPVQYADLPTGVWRHETQYDIAIRRPRTTPFPIPTP